MSTVPNYIIESIKSFPYAFIVYEQYHNNLEFCKLAIELHPNNMTYIKRPSNELVKYLLDQDPYNILFLNNISYNQAQYAIEKSGDDWLQWRIPNYLALEMMYKRKKAKLQKEAQKSYNVELKK